MLYRATGRLLYAIRGPAMPLIIRDRRPAEASPKPERPVRVRPEPPPELTATHAGVPATRHVRVRCGVNPRWRRVSYWWLFSSQRLDDMYL